jgi:hypothetical protein
MFERRTVFVVGAGGSKELGLPMGSELTKTIAERVRFTFPDGYTPKGGDPDIYHAVKLTTQQRGERDANPFYRAGQAIARGMHQAISIDNFLHTHSDDEHVIFMGKLGIASAILEAERKAKIASDNDQDKLLDFGGIPDSWHAVFVKMLLEGSSRADPSNIFDNVAIITFNYDRCIERYLLHSLQSYLGMTRVDAEALLARLTIIHPYGQVGVLPTGKANGISFGKRIHPSDLPGVAAQIKTFTERVEDEAMLQRMHRLLAEAEVVVYLGFSYGDMNMELMTLKNAGERVIYGTSLGISAPNQMVIEGDITNAMGPERTAVKRVELAALTCTDFLYAYWKPIIRGI